MRSIFVALIFSSLVCAGQSSPAHTNAVLQQARAQAKAESKNILVMFTASWCYWCGKMKKSLEDDSCKDIFSKHYIIRYLVTQESDAKKHLENPGADSLKQQHGGEGQGMPYWLILDADAKLLADSRIANTESGKTENTGCPASEKEVAYFVSVLAKTSSLKPEELEVIRKRFRQNEQ